MELERLFPEHRHQIYTLAPDIKAVWGMQILAVGMACAILALIADLLWLSTHLFFPGFLSIAIAVATLPAAILLPWLYYRRWKFLLLEEELVIQRGVVVHRLSFIPLTRIQHLEIVRTLWQRLFQLSTLVIFTAGTRKADVRIPGLDAAFAFALRDYIRQYLVAQDAV